MTSMAGERANVVIAVVAVFEGDVSNDAAENV